jgi:membrane-anchored protein YejM (alkaline phosphatase superfamily)
MEKSFWEKLGFKDKQKEDRNLKEAKDKTDKIYRYLKETIYKR